ncbi:MAG: peroxide stress protein YaaA, partial [Bacteroidetes bacterium]
FKDWRNGQLKSIFLYAKQARGLMCDFAIREQLSSLEGLKDFTGMGYTFDEERSTETDWLFTRES